MLRSAINIPFSTQNYNDHLPFSTHATLTDEFRFPKLEREIPPSTTDQKIILFTRMEDFPFQVHAGRYFPLNCNQEVPTLSTADLRTTLSTAGLKIPLFQLLTRRFSILNS
jgi:hypothetical protein